MHCDNKKYGVFLRFLPGIPFITVKRRLQIAVSKRKGERIAKGASDPAMTYGFRLCALERTELFWGSEEIGS